MGGTKEKKERKSLFEVLWDDDVMTTRFQTGLITIMLETDATQLCLTRAMVLLQKCTNSPVSNQQFIFRYKTSIKRLVSKWLTL
jgi:hypothetical protein